MQQHQKKTQNSQRKQGFKLAVGQLGLFDSPVQTKSKSPSKNSSQTKRRKFDVRNRIRNLEEENHLVVEDDLLLIFMMWKEDGLEKVLKSNDPGAWVIWFMSRATSTESIVRSRRELTSTKNGSPEILVREEINENRKKRSEEWREYWGNPDSTIDLSEAQRFLEKEVEFMRRRAGIDIHGFPPFKEVEKSTL